MSARNPQKPWFKHLRQWSDRYQILAFFISVLVLIAMLGLIELAVSNESEYLKTEQFRALNNDLTEISLLVSHELNAAVYFTMGLKAYIVANNGRLQEEALAPWLKDLQTRGQSIRNIGLAPNNRITHIYPLEGNESAIGLYYPDVPSQWPDVLEVITSRRAKLIGPFPLRQGGQGFVYREAIYLNDDRYWGIVSTVLDVEKLFKGIEAKAAETQMSLRILDLTSMQSIMGVAKPSPWLHSSLPLKIPGRDWVLEGYQQPDTISSRLEAARVLAWVASLFTAYLLLRYIQSSKEKTRVQKELHESQLRFSRAFSASPQGMALLQRTSGADSQDHWIEINDSFCGLLGWKKETFEGKELLDIFESDARDEVNGIVENLNRQYSSTDTHYHQFEVKLNAASGQLVMGMVSLGIYYRTEKSIHWMVQVIDISERAKLDQLKNDFVSTVSHELRTPLTSIVGGLKILASGAFGKFEPQVDKIIGIATQNSEKLAQLINDLLDMDKLIAGKMELHLTHQALAPLLLHALETNKPFADQHQVSFKLTLPDEPIYVNVDGLRLQQVMSNLLSNAAKFSPSGSQIVINTSFCTEGIQVNVIDQGSGISLDDQKKLFRKFSQINSSSTRPQGGSGLGLAISKELMSKMNGTLGLTSSVGEGSTFYFVLPLSVMPELAAQT